MGSVHSITPKGFKVIDLLNAHARSLGKAAYKVVNPETRLEIAGEVLNLNVIGISVKSPTRRPEMGFPDGRDEGDVVVYEIGAHLNLTPIPAGTLPGIPGEAWEMIVEDADDMERFVPIAELLAKEFGVEIVLNPYSKDDDSAHLEPVAANPDFPDGPKICRVLPRI